MNKLSLDQIYQASIKTKAILENYSEFITISPELRDMCSLYGFNVPIDLSGLVENVHGECQFIETCKNHPCFETWEKEFEEKGYFIWDFGEGDKKIDEEFINDCFNNLVFIQIFFTTNYLGQTIYSSFKDPYFYEILYQNLIEENEPDEEFETIKDASIKIELKHLTTEELYYALRLLNDDLLRKFLSRYDTGFDLLYKLITDKQKDIFIKEIKTKYWQINNKDVLFYFMSNPENLFAEDILKRLISSYNKNKELIYLSDKESFKKMEEIGYPNIQQSKIKYQNNLGLLFEETLNSMSNLSFELSQNCLIPEYNKDNLNTRYEKLFDLLNIPILSFDENSDKNSSSRANQKYIIKKFFNEASAIMKEKINGIKDEESRTTYSQLLKFFQENFIISSDGERILKDNLNHLVTFLDSINERVGWFYAFILLLFPKTSTKKTSEDALLYDNRFKKNLFKWKVKPKDEPEFIDRFIKYFPQFESITLQNTELSIRSRQLRSLEKIQKDNDWAWIEEWKKEVWDIAVYDMIHKPKEKRNKKEEKD